MASATCLTIDTSSSTKSKKVFLSENLAFACLSASSSRFSSVLPSGASAAAARLAADTEAASLPEITRCTKEPSADMTMLKPSTTAITSSSATPDSVAASSSSRASMNEIDTLRSAPTAVSAALAVPPKPAVSAMPVDLAAARLCEETRLLVCPLDCERAAREGGVLLTRVAAWQIASGDAGYGCLMTRRLVLATALPKLGPGKRKERTWKNRDAAFGMLTPSSGAVYGCTLENLTAFLVRAGATRHATVVNQLRAFLGPAAASLCASTGDDRDPLSRALASGHVVRSQRRALAELDAAAAPKRRHDIVSPGTAVSGVASLLASLWIVACTAKTTEADIRRLVESDAVVRFLSDHSRTLRDWRPETLAVPDEHHYALMAERRATERAEAAARAVLVHAPASDATTTLRRQIQWARDGAWPRGVRIDDSTHADLCAEFAAARFFAANSAAASAKAIVGSLGPWKPLKVVPLAMLGGPAAPRRGLDSDTDTDTAASSLSLNSSGSSSGRASTASNAGDSVSFLLRDCEVG